MSLDPIPNNLDGLGFATALAEARKGYREGGIPIGAALVFHGDNIRDEAKGSVVLGCGHNQRIQKSSPTLHAEMAALEDAGRQKVDVYKRSTIVSGLVHPLPLGFEVLESLTGCTQYTTLSPCIMCTGAILLYKIPRVVIGENVNLVGCEDMLKSNGIDVVVLNDSECKALLRQYIKENPEDWNEDIGA